MAGRKHKTAAIYGKLGRLMPKLPTLVLGRMGTAITKPGDLHLSIAKGVFF